LLHIAKCGADAGHEQRRPSGGESEPRRGADATVNKDRTASTEPRRRAYGRSDSLVQRSPLVGLDGGVRQHHIAIGAGLDLHLEGMNVAAFAYLSFNPFGEGVFVMKLNALMVRYIVNDVDAAVAFYSQRLGVSSHRSVGPILCDPLAREYATRAESTQGAWRGIATDARRPQT
jgi:hypothetical protein